MIYNICCIVKNEHKFIKEWVDYHLNLGFNHIHIYEDYGSDSHASIFEDSKYTDKITIIPLGNSILKVQNYNNSNTQFTLYKKYAKYCKDNKLADWVLFTDIDEFLVFDEGYNLDKLTEEYKDATGILLCWKMYGACGHIKSPHPEKGVIEAYPYSNEGYVGSLRWTVKSFVNIANYKGFNDLHNVSYAKMTNGFNTDNPDNPRSFAKAWINHYYSKSWEDYCYRIFKRGNMSNNFRTCDQFFQANPDMKHLKKKLINSVRYIHAKDTMWISKDLKIISGGNVNKINKLNKLRRQTN